MVENELFKICVKSIALWTHLICHYLCAISSEITEGLKCVCVCVCVYVCLCALYLCIHMCVCDIICVVIIHSLFALISCMHCLSNELIIMHFCIIIIIS